VVAEEDMCAGLPKLTAAWAERAYVWLPWAVAVGWGGVHDLLARPYLEHSWDSIETTQLPDGLSRRTGHLGIRAQS